MKISQKSWKKYIDKLNKLDTKASKALAEYFRNYPVEEADNLEKVLECAYALATYYGEGAAELACEMYDAVGRTAKRMIPPAEPAMTPTYGEVAKTVQGTLLQTKNPDAVGASVGRLVKRTGLDTVMNNALRDGAQFAWIPNGDTCAFCLMLASNGWQYASKKALKNGHASHVHSNCDCTYAVRFDDETEVEGYDPDYYKGLYDSAEGDSWKDKVNSIRREKYTENRDKINSQKRVAYAIRQGNDISAQHSGIQITELIKQLEKEAKEWENMLTDAEKRSIKKYAFNPGDKKPNRFFERINRALRKDDYSDSGLNYHIDNISNGIKKFKIKHDFTVYRRVEINPIENLNEGDVFKGKQFFSTSVNPDKALQKDYLIEILVKEGTSGAYINLLSEFDQTELLLDKDVIYRVKSLQNKKAILEVIV